jgi:hypothetical protein
MSPFVPSLNCSVEETDMNVILFRVSFESSVKSLDQLTKIMNFSSASVSL